MKRKIFEAYANAIAKQFHLTLDEMFEPTKKRDVVDARHILYYMANERPIKIAQIKRYLDELGFNVSYSSIMYGYNKAKSMVHQDPDYKELIKKIEGVH